MRKKNTPIITTQTGAVRGIRENGFLSFKGIPFARAKRFHPPVICSWNDILDCTHFGKKAMQPIDEKAPWLKKQSPEEFSEDCLNLNIYVPENASSDQKLPVLLEIHGGGFQNCSNQERTPRQVVREEDIIYVAVNYRLGILGYLYLGEILGKEYQASGNNGLLDQLAAIRWTFENIEAFGGDPQQITVLGSSAGAKSISALMMLPELNHYTQRVILSSGATQCIRSLDTSRQTTAGYLNAAKQFMAKQHRPFAVKDLLHIPAEDLIQIQKIFCDNPGNTCMFGPVADGIVIPEDWQPIAENGTFYTGNAMIGCSRNEFAFFKLFQKNFLQDAPAISDALFGQNTVLARNMADKLILEYEQSHGSAPSADTQADIWVRVITDYMYRLYSYRLAHRLAQKGNLVWQYHVELLPALHCADQSLAFGGNMPAMERSPQDEAQAREVGDCIFQSFVQFIRHGRMAVRDGGSNAHLPDFLRNWLPLTSEAPRAMYWDTSSAVRDIPEGDVLDGFPEEVYIL